jgi:hypothetical protein
MHCPKCGFQQDDGPECLRCGVVFARLHTAAVLSSANAQRSERMPDQSKSGLFRRIYRIFRWISLAALIFVILLILRTSPTPQIEVTPDAAKQAEAKVQKLQTSFRQDEQARVELNEAELNGWLEANLALKRPEGSAPAPPQSPEAMISLAKRALATDSINRQELEQARSSVRDVKIQLQEDSLSLYAIFDMHGKDLSLELDGRLAVENGYVRLEPTGGKLGSLPLASATLQGVVNRLFNSPENKEKFRLPPYIYDIQIQHGQIVISSR